jgi:protein involved in temperature-dependent protein secretion
MVKPIAATIVALVFASNARAQSTLFTQNASDATPVVHEKKWQEDLSNLSQSIGQRILLTDATGTVRE